MSHNNPFLAMAQMSEDFQDPSMTQRSRPRAAEEVLRDAREKHSRYKNFMTTFKPVARRIGMTRIQFGDGDFAADVQELQRFQDEEPLPDPLPDMEAPVQVTRTLSRTASHGTALRRALGLGGPEGPIATFGTRPSSSQHKNDHNNYHNRQYHTDDKDDEDGDEGVDGTDGLKGTCKEYGSGELRPEASVRLPVSRTSSRRFCGMLGSTLAACNSSNPLSGGPVSLGSGSGPEDFGGLLPAEGSRSVPMPTPATSTPPTRVDSFLQPHLPGINAVPGLATLQNQVSAACVSRGSLGPGPGLATGPGLAPGAAFHSPRLVGSPGGGLGVGVLAASASMRRTPGPYSFCGNERLDVSTAALGLHGRREQNGQGVAGGGRGGGVLHHAGSAADSAWGPDSEDSPGGTSRDSSAPGDTGVASWVRAFHSRGGSNAALLSRSSSRASSRTPGASSTAPQLMLDLSALDGPDGGSPTAPPQPSMSGGHHSHKGLLLSSVQGLRTGTWHGDEPGSGKQRSPSGAMAAAPSSPFTSPLGISTAAFRSSDTTTGGGDSGGVESGREDWQQRLGSAAGSGGVAIAPVDRGQGGDPSAPVAVSIHAAASAAHLSSSVSSFVGASSPLLIGRSGASFTSGGPASRRSTDVASEQPARATVLSGWSSRRSSRNLLHPQLQNQSNSSCTTGSATDSLAGQPAAGQPWSAVKVTRARLAGQGAVQETEGAGRDGGAVSDTVLQSGEGEGHRGEAPSFLRMSAGPSAAAAAAAFSGASGSPGLASRGTPQPPFTLLAGAQAWRGPSLNGLPQK